MIDNVFLDSEDELMVDPEEWQLTKDRSRGRNVKNTAKVAVSRKKKTVRSCGANARENAFFDTRIANAVRDSSSPSLCGSEYFSNLYEAMPTNRYADNAHHRGFYDPWDDKRLADKKAEAVSYRISEYISQPLYCEVEDALARGIGLSVDIPPLEEVWLDDEAKDNLIERMAAMGITFDVSDEILDMIA